MLVLDKKERSMSRKKQYTYPAYHGHYHLVVPTKYKGSCFYTSEMRSRLREIIETVLQELEGVELVACAVAINHIHVLVKSSQDISLVARYILGVSSRYMRKEYPELIEFHKTALWDGKSCRAIRDAEDLRNCILYIGQHLPNDTKTEDEFT